MSEGNHNQNLDWDPLFLGLFGLLCGAIIVGAVDYSAINWCRNRRARVPSTSRARSARPRLEVSTTNAVNSSSTHLLKVYIYSKELKEATCAVCLSEFVEGEKVRILPDCEHAFHVPCVDMWLYSHPNCPLCRTCTTPRQSHVELSLPSSDEPQMSLESFPQSSQLTSHVHNRLSDFGG